MSNFLEHAEEELKKITAGTDNIYGSMFTDAVMELCKVMDKQNHSGMSFGLVWQSFAAICLHWYHPELMLSTVKKEEVKSE